MIVRARDLSVRYRSQARWALAQANLDLADGELVAVVGPNGCGKTTLLRALLGTAPIQGGEVVLGGKPLDQWRRVELARLVALVPQREESPFSWRVREMVEFGRYVWRGPLSAMTAEDQRAVQDAITRCDLEAFRDRRVETLSGGEWQRVRLARALAQEARVLFLDEPTASLDLGHEMELLELVRSLVKAGMAALVVTHQLNLAARFADRILLLSEGQVMASGSPEEVMQATLLSRVFRWPVSVGVSPEGRPQIVPLRDYS
jgi:iron complex transport system ATP-binding protein